MVQEYQSPVRVYEHPFELVMAAYQKRFPTCPMIPAFLGSEIKYEYKSDDGAIHIVERRCKLNVDAPYLLRKPLKRKDGWLWKDVRYDKKNGKIAGVDYVYFIQRNSLDRRDRTLKIEAFNESFSSRIEIKEHCYYSVLTALYTVLTKGSGEKSGSIYSWVHQENPQWTVFEQDASLVVKSFFGFEAAVEKLAVKAYTNNLKKGKEIILHYINELISDGVTYIPPFEESKGRPRALSVKEKRDSEAASDDEDSVDFALGEEASEQPKQHEKEDLVQDRLKGSVEPPPLQEYKLEDSFIERYLGCLTPLEESALMQLRRKLAATHQGKMPGESVILRFLRARDCNIDKAFEMLKNSLHWRRQHHVDTILQTWNPPSELTEYYPGGWHHFDKDGRPVYVIRFGTMDIKGLIKSVGAEGFVKQVVTINEEGLKRCEEATRIFEKPVTSWTCLCDLEGLSMRHLWRPGVRAVLNIIEVVEANYPETMGRLLIVRAPRVFGVVWTLFSPFIDENSRKKFLIYSGNDYQGPGGLADYIDSEYIPDFLGGHCECNVLEGRPVPKTFYKYQNIEDTSETSWLGTDLYQTAQIMKGSPHEVMITVTEAESVITWDFDVIDGDVMFTCLRHKRPRELSEGNLTGCLGETMSSRFSGVRPGVDAVVVEKPISCSHGESVQGTHICNCAGVYILQWKYSSPASSSRGPPKHLHRAKFLYYYEVLPSKDFRGSMSSLESSHSGFSQLSISTSATHSSRASENTSNSNHSAVSR